MVKQKSKPPKPRMGRPSLSGIASAGERSPPVAIRMAAADLEKVDAIADREGVKRSEMVRRLLLAGIAAYKPAKAAK